LTRVTEKSEHFITYKSFWYGQDFAEGSPGLRFSLSLPTTVRVVLANWNPYTQRSRWTLRRVLLFAAS
jgi:hypothetical protein